MKSSLITTILPLFSTFSAVTCAAQTQPTAASQPTEVTAVQAKGKPDPEALKAFMASHTDNLGQANFLAANNPPASYANSAYYGIHTFKFVNRENKITLVRWRFVPQDGEKQLSNAELTSMPRDFLEKALIERANKGPVRWDMLLTIGAPGYAQNYPTVLWP